MCYEKRFWITDRRAAFEFQFITFKILRIRIEKTLITFFVNSPIYGLNSRRDWFFHTLLTTRRCEKQLSIHNRLDPRDVHTMLLTDDSEVYNDSIIQTRVEFIYGSCMVTRPQIWAMCTIFNTLYSYSSFGTLICSGLVLQNEDFQTRFYNLNKFCYIILVLIQVERNTLQKSVRNGHTNIFFYHAREYFR